MICAEVETEGLTLTTEFAGIEMPCSVIGYKSLGGTVCIDGHGQPVDKNSVISVTVHRLEDLKKANDLCRWLTKKGYENAQVFDTYGSPI